ncbi:peptidoglycan-recognition protein 1-like [Lutzomyia longipalpis]|uniref:peptidoglycan-recognition protein 1-like n=1 Tax=Lutzomyia longipalpis TaxID=7200 RepID=UPI0024841A11|nr:peptidoglycan-recognition protein 1-like [Lutzomyia longipalpis]
MKSSISFIATILICCAMCETPPSIVLCSSVVSRDKWNANAATETNFLELPVKIVIICHTVTPECTTLQACIRRVKSIQKYHQKEKHWGDIAYNFLIGNDGRVYEGIGWDKVGRHTKQFNEVSIGIAFIGNFSAKPPSKAALDAAKNLLQCGCAEGHLDANYTLFGARDVSNTESPGANLNQEIQNWSHWMTMEQGQIIIPRK